MSITLANLWGLKPQANLALFPSFIWRQCEIGPPNEAGRLGNEQATNTEQSSTPLTAVLKDDIHTLRCIQGTLKLSSSSIDVIPCYKRGTISKPHSMQGMSVCSGGKGGYEAAGEEPQ